MISVRYYAPLSGMLGKTEEQIEAKTISDVLRHIKSVYGKSAYASAKSSLIIVNDVSIGLYHGMKTVLSAEDVVGFLPLCGGG